MGPMVANGLRGLCWLLDVSCFLRPWPSEYMDVCELRVNALVISGHHFDCKASTELIIPSRDPSGGFMGRSDTDSVMLTSPFTSQVRDLQRPLAIKSCWR